MSIALYSLVIALLMIFPRQTALSAGNALLVFGRDLVPALFPYMVFSRLLAERLKKSSIPPFPAAALLGVLGGSPSGASIVCAYADRLSERAIFALSAMTGTLSPMFILGTVSAWTNGRIDCSVLLFVHLLSAIASSLAAYWLYGCMAARIVCRCASSGADTDVLRQSIDAVFMAGGCIICFSVLAGMLEFLPGSVKGFQALLHGMMEIAGGVHALTQTDLPDRQLAVICAVLCGFSGFSILSQNQLFLKTVGITRRHLLYFAMLRALFSFVLMAIF